MAEYPEHEKMRAVKKRSQIIGEFLEELSGIGLTLCESTDHFECPWTPTGKSTQQVLAQYFKIDLDKIEKEKRAMLDELRSRLK